MVESIENRATPMNYVDTLELDMMQRWIDDGEPLDLDQCRHLLAEVRRLKEKEGWGNLLVPLIDWQHDMLSQTVCVRMILPVVDIDLPRRQFLAKISNLQWHVKHTFLRCWEVRHRRLSAGEEVS